MLIRFLGILVSFASLQAQGISGVWQGTLGEAGDKVRLVVQFHRAQTLWTGGFFNIDQNPDRGAGTPLKSVSVQGSAIQFRLDDGGAFEGIVNSDRNSITGTWIQGIRQPLTFQRATAKTEWKHASAHTARFVPVDHNVKLEVLDWGGSGRSMLLLAGLGNTAHVFDALAGKLAASYHVYGLTRRGFGASSAPKSGYGADRLADDVLEVMDALKLNKPVLMGHSIAGEELSSIGSRYPGKVAGLIYLDAGNSYAFYDSSVGDPFAKADLATFPPMHRAVLEGRQRYTRIQGPILAIFAFAGAPDHWEAQANAFEKGVPGARVVRFPQSGHYLFLSDEAPVLREITTFVGTLP